MVGEQAPTPTPIPRPTPEQGIDPDFIAPPEFFDKLDSIVVRTTALTAAKELRDEAKLNDPRNRTLLDTGQASIDDILGERSGTTELPKAAAQPTRKARKSSKKQPLGTSGQEMSRRIGNAAQGVAAPKTAPATEAEKAKARLAIRRAQWVQRVASTDFLRQPIEAQMREADHFFDGYNTSDTDV